MQTRIFVVLFVFLSATVSPIFAGDLIGAATFAQTGGFYDADITQLGVDYVDISGIYYGIPHIEPDPGQEGCVWYPDGAGRIFTSWDHGGAANHRGHCLWAMYYPYLTRGYWRIGLNAINHGLIKDRKWYSNFEVLIEVNGEPGVPEVPSSKRVLRIPASDEMVNHGYEWFYIPRSGFYGVKLTWLNDKSECFGSPDNGQTCYDVNIMIDSVFFDKWDEENNSKPQEKVQLCHINSANDVIDFYGLGFFYSGKIIEVSSNAVDAHLAHGDVIFDPGNSDIIMGYWTQEIFDFWESNGYTKFPNAECWYYESR